MKSKPSCWKWTSQPAHCAGLKQLRMIRGKYRPALQGRRPGHRPTTNLASFGAFIGLPHEIDGLVHISQISEERVDKIKNVLKVGQEVTARVIKIDRADRRIGLSIKAANYSEEQLRKDAAIAGSAIMAFSVSNVHYSRLALNNIVTQFFWATCFFFLLRALRSRRPSDWVLAGLSAGLSDGTFIMEHGFCPSSWQCLWCSSLHFIGAVSLRGRFRVAGGKLSRWIWSAVSSLYSESEPLSGARSKPPHLVTAYSD